MENLKNENLARELAISELERERTEAIEAMLDKQKKLKDKENELRAEIAAIRAGKKTAPDTPFRTKTQVSSWLLDQGLKPTSEEYMVMYRKYSKDLPLQ